MQNSLQTLERIKKFELDEQRRLLVVELEKEERLQTELANLIENYEQEKQFVMQNPTLCDFGAYTKQYLENRKKLEKKIKEVQAKIEQIRDIMADMFKEQKTYKIVAENRRKQKQKEIETQEQKMLDEIGTNTYIKKHN